MECDSELYRGIAVAETNRLEFVSRYRRLVLEAVLETMKPEIYRERVVIEAVSERSPMISNCSAMDVASYAVDEQARALHSVCAWRWSTGGGQRVTQLRIGHHINFGESSEMNAAGGASIGQ